MNLFARVKAAPDSLAPRTLETVKTEITATDQELVQIGSRLTELYREFPEDKPIAGAFRMSSSRPLHREIVALAERRAELLKRWPQLLAEYAQLKV